MLSSLENGLDLLRASSSINVLSGHTNLLSPFPRIRINSTGSIIPVPYTHNSSYSTSDVSVLNPDWNKSLDKLLCEILGKFKLERFNVTAEFN
jgi:hypothetical protein